MLKRWFLSLIHIYPAPPRYDEAFKAGAVRMVTEQGRPSREVAAELGICIDTLRSCCLLYTSGISKSALGSYEKEDYKEINHGNLITLADFYGVSVDYLLCRTENREQILSLIHIFRLAGHRPLTACNRPPHDSPRQVPFRLFCIPFRSS